MRFQIPIRQAFFVHMVGKDDLPNAIALNSSIFNGARVVGPAIAGFMIVLIGEGWCFFLNAFSYVAVDVSGVTYDAGGSRPETKRFDVSPMRGFLEGCRFASNDIPIRSALLLLSLLSFFLVCSIRFFYRFMLKTFLKVAPQRWGY